MFGKWHLGDNYPYRPEDRGYTEVMRHGGGGVGQTPDYWDNAYFDGSYWHNGKPEKVTGFCTDVFFDYAQQFIRQQKSDGKPFLAYIATNAPHGPMHSPPEYSNPYSDQKVHLANFYGMIANIDENVGRMRDFLNKEGLADNTIFIFTTDNGSSSGWETYNAGMRAGKGSPYDGGHRVPFMIRWPAGGLEQAHDVTPITAHVDVLPTLIDLCEIAAPADIDFDGVSIASLLRKEDAGWPDRILVTDSQRVKDPIKWRQSSVMTSQWRLINGEELYDIHKDPGQVSDVASGNPQVVQRLREFYEAWWKELEPTFANDTAIYLGHPRDNPARLTSHDWITTEMTPWNQSQIRSAMNGDSQTGYWNVNIVADGVYTVRLRRWPEEANAAIDASLPPGSPVPGERAFRATPGQRIQPTSASLRIGEATATLPVKPGQMEVVFQMTLATGKSRMSALFHEADGTEYGAYYAYVMGPATDRRDPK
jgi:arylsulfatase B